MLRILSDYSPGYRDPPKRPAFLEDCIFFSRRQSHTYSSLPDVSSGDEAASDRSGETTSSQVGELARREKIEPDGCSLQSSAGSTSWPSCSDLILVVVYAEKVLQIACNAGLVKVAI